MKRVWELEVWSKPGNILDSEYGQVGLQKKILDKGFPPDVFLGITAIPDQVDCLNLQRSIKSGDLTFEGFIDFCETRGFEADIKSELSSMKYFEYVEGRCLAWIHLPEGLIDRLLFPIVRAVEEHGHIVLDPVTMAQIKLPE